MTNKKTNGTCLQIDFAEPDEVVFRRGLATDLNHWMQLLNFWSNDGMFNPDQFEFKTSLPDYLLRRQWFKINWKEKARPYSISESLRSAIQLAEADKEEFNNAVAGNNFFSPEKIDLSGVKRTPTPEQIDNIACSLSIKNGANFSVPGAGKTMTTLLIWNHLKQNKSLDKLLVISPKSAFETWSEAETTEIFYKQPKTQILSKEKIEQDTEILILNFEKLESEKYLHRLTQWIKKNSVMVVIDEAHRIKGGPKSIRWLACRQLTELANRVELLTGTPMPQSFDDLRNLLRVSWTKLPNTYLTDNELRLLKPRTVYVRTTKNQLRLPPFKQHEIAIDMGDFQSQIYSALRRSYVGSFAINSSTAYELARRGKVAMTLIAAATNPGLLAGSVEEDAYLNLSWPPKEISHNEELMSLISNYVSYEMPPKFKWIIKFLERSVKDNKKTIIWSSLVGNLRTMKKLLGIYNPALVYGGVKGEIRYEEIERFRNDPSCHILLTNPQTLGEGISLHKQCHQAIYLDRTYNAGHYLQSLDRIHRLGLPEDVITNVYVLTSNLSIDNRINVQLERKISRMAELLDDSSLQNSASLEYDEYDVDSIMHLNDVDFSELMRHIVENDVAN